MGVNGMEGKILGDKCPWGKKQGNRVWGVMLGVLGLDSLISLCLPVAQNRVLCLNTNHVQACHRGTRSSAVWWMLLGVL